MSWTDLIKALLDELLKLLQPKPKKGPQVEPLPAVGV